MGFDFSVLSRPFMSEDCHYHEYDSLSVVHAWGGGGKGSALLNCTHACMCAFNLDIFTRYTHTLSSVW